MVTLVEKVCPVCGKTFTGRKNQKFCSPTCKEINHRENRKEQRSEYYEKNKEKIKNKMKSYNKNKVDKIKEEVEKICPVCGKVFTTSDNKQKYCSAECRYVVEKEKIKEYNRKDPTYERVCPICEKVFIAHNARRVFCSEECLKVSNNKRLRDYRKNDSDFRDNHIKQTLEWKEKVKELGMTLAEFEMFKASGADVDAYLEQRRKEATRICKVCGKTFISYNKVNGTRTCLECRELLKIKSKK